MTKTKLLAGMMATVVAMTGCGAQEASGKEKVTIRLAHFADPYESQLVNKQVAEFEKQNPHIDVIAEPYAGDFFEVLTTRMASNNEPDVFYMDIAQKDKYIDADRLLDLTQHVDKEDIKDFQPNLLNAFKENDGLYGLPKDTNTLALFYNKRMLEEAGITPPKTWNELKEAAKALTTKDVAGLVTVNEIPRFQPIMTSFGGEIMQDGKPVVNDQASLKALEFWLSLFEEGIAASPVDLGVGWSGDAFAQEKAAMSIEGSWMIQSLQEVAPTLEYGMVELPVEKEASTLMFTVAYAGSANTEHPEETVQLIEFLTSQEAQELTVESGRALPSRLSMEEPYLEKYPERAAFVKGIAYAEPFNYGIASSTVISETTKAAERVVLGKSTTKQAFNEAQKKINEVVNK